MSRKPVCGPCRRAWTTLSLCGIIVSTFTLACLWAAQARLDAAAAAGGAGAGAGAGAGRASQGPAAAELARQLETLRQQLTFKEQEVGCGPLLR